MAGYEHIKNYNINMMACMIAGDMMDEYVMRFHDKYGSMQEYLDSFEDLKKEILWRFQNGVIGYGEIAFTIENDYITENGTDNGMSYDEIKAVFDKEIADAIRRGTIS